MRLRFAAFERATGIAGVTAGTGCTHASIINVQHVCRNMLSGEPRKRECYHRPVPAKKPDRQFNVGDKVRVTLHHGKIEDVVARAVIQDDDGIKVQVDVVGLDLTALIDTRQVSE